ncbi:hypothetical protein [Roseitalea porphyridii]|uniref:Uncharacterized protein n=1 Tax=Roseitalea porphyridii TaxID=1852022 RepID=A0A4V1A3P0_9HYPH|nr:hypothetical protein [Roseitalea porphyridii]QBK29788.1 hypothetical protein E0E05_03735 [Roseitalea porphyridii]
MPERKIIDGRLHEKRITPCFVCDGAGEYDVHGTMPMKPCEECGGTGHDPEGPFVVWGAIERVPARKSPLYERLKAMRDEKSGYEE